MRLVTHEPDYTSIKLVSHVLLNIARKGWKDQETTNVHEPLNIHEEYETVLCGLKLTTH